MDESSFRRPERRRGRSGDDRGPDEKGAAQRRCCFPDALGARVAGCTMAVKARRQYRRAVYCADSRAHGTCVKWLEQVRNAARFSLGTPRTPSALPRRTAARLQCGGLLGLGELIEKQPVPRVQDVSGLLRQALTRYGSFDRVPLQAVVKKVHDLDIDGPKKP